MDAKEKAKDLVDKFFSISGHIRFAQNYALIAIDEIALKLQGHHKDAIASDFVEYWQDVKDEINKL